jgi:hypothetical protein
MSDAQPTRLPFFRFPAIALFRLSTVLRRFPPSAFPLRRYFYSGWAFLIPYLAAYLLYYVLKWPVNAAGSERAVKVAGETGGFALSRLHSLIPPSLLHVYWVLHAINVGLAVVALVSWWRGRWQGIACKQAPTALLSPVKQNAGTSQESAKDVEKGVSAFRFQLSAFLPWLLLALLFYIPGAYMEFPADTWEHYGRINEWSWLQTVGDHTDWAKSSYFFAYSLLGRIAPPTRQLFLFDFYYTGCCLLLCWQYYRLARAVGLERRASLLFVILQSVLFGNNIFGFYRYYGLSSTILAQLGAIAMVRIAIEYASQKFQFPRLKFQGTGEFPHGDGLHHKALNTTQSDMPAAHGPLLLSPFSLLQAGASALALLLFIAFNHPQCLGIAALGLAAVVIWRLIGWRRSMVWWLAAAALALSVATVLWWPRNPALDSGYRPGGWLTAWYGFNVFSFSTDAGDRTRQIVGFFGLINLAAALVLLRRNHVVAWLTLIPLVALCFPFVAIPFSGILAKHTTNWGLIILFQRMLLAIPAGLALICAAGSRANQTVPPQSELGTPTAHDVIACKQAPTDSRLPLSAFPLSRFAAILPSASSVQPSAFVLLLLTLSALLLVPANRPFYNRFWQALMVPPDDLTMHQVIEAADTMPGGGGSDGSKFGDTVPLTVPGVGSVLESAGRACLFDTTRLVQKSPALVTDAIVEKLRLVDPGVRRDEPFWAADFLYTPYSQSGFLSGHWRPWDVALELSTQEELFRVPLLPAAERRPPQLWLAWTSRPGTAAFYGERGSEPLRAAIEDRGSINSQQGFATPVAGDQLVLTPMLETVDCSGWRVCMNLTGPGCFHRSFEVTQRPTHLASEHWIHSNFKVRFPKPGQYTIELVGDLLWPARTYTVRYTLTVAVSSQFSAPLKTE